MGGTTLIAGGSGYLGSRLVRQAQQTWRVVGEIRSQPMYPELSAGQRRYVVDAIREFVGI
ncbi:hypothetical protein ACFLWA_06725 [Chloroflexota bacterium]